jgi:hypothetical protein
MGAKLRLRAALSVIASGAKPSMPPLRVRPAIDNGKPDGFVALAMAEFASFYSSTIPG